MDGITASDRHERQLLERVSAAAAELERTEAEANAARERRDQAVRAAVRAGVPGGLIAQGAGVSQGLVSRLTNAPRG
ncbi:hypothetical protein FNH13_17675 [Ornithinimicrobium ciconiae]|uniref:Uncharacterized protein n=1 Tax=Ornithinimicrobium ciconiae TaxID=2594265 RepID=A0A516GF16_9MICO|nr:hypothetical protein [Ornithinimicrobium ciconiae]QDO89930.1 hypothetical protein FNH13_17675 [Ornithinimicrobium ciconiae]